MQHQKSNDITVKQAAELLAKRAAVVALVKKADINPYTIAGFGLGGAALGGLGGYLLGDEDERTGVSRKTRALTGALAGGGLGLGLGAGISLGGSVKEPTPQERLRAEDKRRQGAQPQAQQFIAKALETTGDVGKHVVGIGDGSPWASQAFSGAALAGSVGGSVRASGLQSPAALSAVPLGASASARATFLDSLRKSHASLTGTKLDSVAVAPKPIAMAKRFINPFKSRVYEPNELVATTRFARKVRTAAGGIAGFGVPAIARLLTSYLNRDSTTELVNNPNSYDPHNPEHTRILKNLKPDGK